MLGRDLGAGCVLHPEEWPTAVRAGALLQRLYRPCRTRPGSLHAGRRGWDTPLCLHPRGGPDTPRRCRDGLTAGQGRDQRGFLSATTARAAAPLAVAGHLSWRGLVLCQEEIPG